ncbi:MAG: endonuclease [Opitutales bacterium]|nr:endonuclease [Opitutales bacterium]
MPALYYAAAEGKTGEELRDALASIIRPHRSISYSWAPFHRLDEDPANPSNVILIYSGFSVPKLPNNTHWNREHLWPRSRGLGSSGTAFEDLFNLVPCDADINNARANLAFGHPSPADPGYRPAGHYVNAPLVSKDDFVWLPPEFDRGFIARALFYMDLRYNGVGSEPNLSLVDDPPASTPWGSVMGNRGALLEWNRAHRPAASEIRRNQLIYTVFQNNRNPFIDYPDLVDAVFTYDLYLAPGTWRVAHFSFAELDDPAISAWDADPDGDGRPNLFEYAFGLNPREPGPDSPVEIRLEHGKVFVTFRKVRDAAVFGLFYTMEASSDLLEWRAVAVQTESKVADGAYHIWKVVSFPASGTQFVRVRVDMATD